MAMILSHAHRFIYIKTFETASTSIETALAAVCGPDDIITPASPPLMKARNDGRAQNWRFNHPLVPKRPILKRLLGRPERYYHPSVGFYEHMPAWRVRAYVGEEIWRSYYKFSFERNPWDRQVSWFFYQTKNKRQRWWAFDDFMRDRKRAYVENFDLYTEQDAVMLDFLGLYERLEDDFARAMRAIGIDGKALLPVTNVSRERNGRDYRRFYTPATRELIADWYAREIALLSYEF